MQSKPLHLPDLSPMPQSGHARPMPHSEWIPTNDYERWFLEYCQKHIAEIADGILAEIGTLTENVD